MKLFQVLSIFHWLVIHEISHIWTYVSHFWIKYKHLWFRSQFHPSFIFLQPFVFPSCSSFFYSSHIPSWIHYIFVFPAPYDNISYYFQPHFIFKKVLQQFGRNKCDPQHHFADIQGTDCVDFSTLWEGVCTYIFSFFRLCFHIRVL